MIVGDAREVKCINIVKSQYDKIQKQFLEVGDFLLPRDIAIERKTGKDFIASISDKRLYKQLNNLCQHKYPIVAIVTDNIWKDMYFSKNRWIHSTFEGALITIHAKYPRVKIIWFDTDEDFCKFLIKMDTKLSEEGSKERPSPMLRKVDTIEERMENLVSAIEGVGIPLSKKLLREYKTIHNLSRASIDDLQKMDKVGKKTATNIHNTLNYVYKKNGNNKRDNNE